MRASWFPLLVLALHGLTSPWRADAATPIQKLDGAAPAFSVRDESGGDLALGDLRGRPVILHFWATWCASCRSELPRLDAFAARVENADVAVLMIAIDRDTDIAAIRAYARELGIAAPVYGAVDGDVTERYWSWGVPVTYLIDRDGRLAGRALGALDWNAGATRAAIERLAAP